MFNHVKAIFSLHSYEVCTWMLMLRERVTPKGAYQTMCGAWTLDRENILSVRRACR
jgi:hypothetical protein